MGRERRSRKRSVRRQILILSDGKTEINYFNLKKEDFKGDRTIKIKPICTENNKKATQFVRYLNGPFSEAYDLNEVKGDRVYCVFDMDDADDEDIQSARKEMPEYMELITSNPDFELWFLLHFRYHQGRLGKREPIDKLREHVSDYKKPDVERIYPSLREKEDDAVKHAERLRAHHKKENSSDLSSTTVNPYTNVDQLITFINGLE